MFSKHTAADNTNTANVTQLKLLVFIFLYYVYYGYGIVTGLWIYGLEVYTSIKDDTYFHHGINVIFNYLVVF